MGKYNFDEQINRYNTSSLKWDFNLERGKQKDILPFWVADMDFKLPNEILNPLSKKLNEGIFGYSECSSNYYNAVSNWFNTHYGINVSKENIIVTPSVIFSICTLIRILTKENDSILISEPVYYPFKESITINNRKTIISNLVIENDKYVIDYKEFEKKIIDNNVKLYILCNPHNPVGRVWDKLELGKIIDICKRNDVFIISDEIHADFIYNKEFFSIGLFDYDKKVIVSAPTKTFNIPGLKISNTIIYDKTLYKKYKIELDKIGYSQQSFFGLYATIYAYSYGEEWLKELKEYIYNNIIYIEKYLKDKLPKIKLIKPEGTYLIWLDFKKYNLTDKKIDDLIINKAKLWFDSGLIFGESGSNYQRINVATSRILIDKMLDSLYKTFKDL
ncbi:MAG: pyridoxal phosphate-dependent aminotransferase [bacterium]|nr:pyridoxal phosphate-dependent aminotransferase [bacterium]